MDQQAELKLVEAAKTDSNSFGQLYDYYFPKVYGFVAVKVNDWSQAEDLTSEIFMKILENIGKFENRGLPFGAWVFRIARNVLNDHYTHVGRYQTSDIDEVFDLHDDEEKNSPSKKAAEEELNKKVKDLLDALPEREARVLQLKFHAGLNNREISHALGMTESNVGIVVFRSLKKLKPELKYFA